MTVSKAQTLMHHTVTALCLETENAMAFHCWKGSQKSQVPKFLSLPFYSGGWGGTD